MHIVDQVTGYSATEIIENRKMDAAVAAFEEIWINKDGPALYVSADVELLNKFTKEIHYFCVKYKPVSAW